MNVFRTNSDVSIRREAISDTHECVIVDDFLQDPHKIVEFAGEADRDLSAFQWAFFPYIAIYPSEEEAANVAAEALGGRYLYGGDFVDIVRNYCLLGTPQQCVDRLNQYIEAGARHIIFSVAGPGEDRVRQIQTITEEIIPQFR